jgi:hypothetical protein
MALPRADRKMLREIIHKRKTTINYQEAVAKVTVLNYAGKAGRRKDLIFKLGFLTVLPADIFLLRQPLLF